MSGRGWFYEPDPAPPLTVDDVLGKLQMLCRHLSVDMYTLEICEHLDQYHIGPTSDYDDAARELDEMAETLERGDVLPIPADARGRTLRRHALLRHAWRVRA